MAGRDTREFGNLRAGGENLTSIFNSLEGEEKDFHRKTTMVYLSG